MVSNNAINGCVILFSSILLTFTIIGLVWILALKRQIGLRILQLRQIIDLLPHFIYVRDREGRFVLVNRTLAEAYQVSASSLEGKQFTEIHPNPHESQENIQHARDVLESNKAIVLDEIFTDRNNHQRNLRTTYVPFVVDQAKSPAVLTISIDVTEQSQSEHKLREKEAFYRNLIEKQGQGLGIVDLDENFLYSNPVADKIFGVAPNSLTGHSLRTFVDEDNFRRIRSETEHRRQGKENTYEIEIIQPSGSIRWIMITATPWINERNDILGVVGIFEDITSRKKSELLLKEYQEHLERLVEARTIELQTSNDKLRLEILERKRAEEALAAEKELLDVTIHSIADGVIAADIQGTIMLSNAIADNLLNLPRNAIIGQSLHNVFTIVNERDHQNNQALINDVMTQQKSMNFSDEIILINPDMTEHLISMGVAPIVGKEGNILGVVIVFRDITQKRKMDEVLLNAQRLESIGLLAGGIAHDYNNILTGIVGFINVGKYLTEPETQIYQSLVKAEKACMRATKLTQQLLTFTHGGDPVKKVVSIIPLLEDTATLALSGSAVHPVFHFSDRIKLVEIDEGQMQRALHNIIHNARQAMPNGGRIEIRACDATPDELVSVTRPDTDYVKIIITDHGIGIPPENLKKIFDPFFSTKAGGSGLGLMITYSIIQKHQGLIYVDSKVDIGTTFTIFIPASKRTQCDPKSDSQELIPGHGKLLLMDDDELILEASSWLLQRAGYEVESVIDGEEAIWLYRESIKQGRPFDAVIMDLTIPGGMGGKETIRELLKISPDCIAIVSSGYSDDDIIAEYRKYGFKGVVRKPHRIEEICQLLSELLKSTL